MKKIVSVLLMAFMLLTCTALAAQENETVYKQAEISEDQTVDVTELENGEFDLLRNGDFETVAASGIPAGWSMSGAIVGESYMTVTAADAPSGKNYARYFGETEGVFLGQNITSMVPGETYQFTAKVRRPSGGGSVIAYVTADGQLDGRLQSIKKFSETVSFGRNKMEWVQVSFACELPEGTERVGFLLRLVGGGEAHWDDVHFVGKLKDELATGISFRNMLAAEAAQDESTNKLAMGDLYSYDKPFEGQENLIANGDFESYQGNTFDAWGLRTNWAPYFSAVPGSSHDGSTCIKASLDANKDGINRPFLTQEVELIPGAEYQVSYWYKIVKGEGIRPWIKLEYQTHEKGLAGITHVGEKYVAPDEWDRSGEWAHAVTKIYPGNNVGGANVLLRAHQGNELEEVEVYWDDVEIFMTAPPPALDVDGGWIFYYPDMKEGELSASVNLSYYPELAESTVDYSISDGKTVLWESRGHKNVEGQSRVTFPLSLLKEKEKPYIGKAVLYAADGSVHSIGTQNVYMYDRPEYLDKDGFFRKNGETPVYPIFGYHVTRTPENLKKLADAGVNVIQTGVDNPGILDMCEEAGIMALITLYPDMKCAGADENIEYTIKMVNYAKDHPATLGYIVMDEVFLHRPDAETELEHSYRLIRSLDKKHPISVLEAMDSFYEKAGKYVDLLLTDPYSKAHVKHASEGTENARAALNYEKPVYSLLETYYATGGSSPGYPTPNDGRNNNWQALIAGAQAVGYYSISDSDADLVTGEQNVPIWNARDGGALWNALASFGNVEKEIAFDHYVFNKTPEFNEYRGADYWYSSWVDGQDIYMIVLGMKKSGTQEVSIPLTSFGGDIQVGAYTAEMIAGRNPLETVTGSGTLDITLSDVEALLYKITPTETVDFSTLGATGFEDLGAYPWARQQIGRMDSLDIITGRNDYSYAPAEKITRAEFAGFLIRALGLSADSTELFADVSADNEFAKEIAIGRALGILKGTDGVNYNPDAEISRQDLMVICARGMRLVKELAEGAPVEGFADAGLIADYAAADVAAMVQAGIIKGNADGTINPLGNTTRAEAAVIMDRCYSWK